jgi:hypothetical protein
MPSYSSLRRRCATTWALALSLAAFAAIPTARAQDIVAANATPRAAVAAAFDAMTHKQWTTVASLADPAYLIQWREQQLVYAEADSIERVNKKKHQKQYGLPKCVQKYFASQESHYAEAFLKGFAGAKSISQLEQFTPEQLFASWLAGGDAVKQASRTTMRTILGEVPESDSLSHVIYRMTPGPAGTNDDGIERITVRRVDGQWRVIPNDDIRLAGRSYSWESK